jgi:hypothetical protein
MASAETIVFEVEVQTDDTASQQLGEVDESVDSLEQSFQDLQQRSELTAEDLQNATVTSAQQASQSMTQLGSSASSAATNLSFELVRASQDASHSIGAVANQIPQMAEQFTQLRSQTGSTRGALSALVSTMTGPTGLLAAGTLLVQFGPKLISFFTDTGEAAQNTEEKVNKVSEAVSSILDVQAGQTEKLELGLEEAGQAIDETETNIQALETILERLPESGTGLVERFDELGPVAKELVQSLTEQSEGLTLSRDLVRQRLTDEKGIRKDLEKQRSKLKQQLRLRRRLKKLGAQSGESQSETFQDLQQQYQDLVSQQERLRENFPGIVDRSQQFQKRIEATREAMRTLSEQDIDVDQSEIRQLRRRLSRLVVLKQELEAPPQAEEVQAAEPTAGTSIEDQLQDVELAGSARELGRQTKAEVQEGASSGLARGIARGAEQGLVKGLQPLFQQTENAFFQALKRALTRAAASAAATKLTQVLGSAEDSDGGQGQDGGIFGSVVEGLLSAISTAVVSGAVFDEGGYTGSGPRSAPAGVVHRGEYVMPKEVVESIGLPVMRAIHETGAKPPTRADLERIAGVPQYASGGLVQRVTQPARPVGDDGGGSGSSAELIREVRRLRDEVSEQTDRLESVERRVVVSRRESRDIVETGEAERSSKNPSR